MFAFEGVAVVSCRYFSPLVIVSLPSSFCTPVRVKAHLMAADEVRTSSMQHPAKRHSGIPTQAHPAPCDLHTSPVAIPSIAFSTNFHTYFTINYGWEILRPGLRALCGLTGGRTDSLTDWHISCLGTANREPNGRAITLYHQQRCTEHIVFSCTSNVHDSWVSCPPRTDMVWNVSTVGFRFFGYLRFGDGIMDTLTLNLPQTKWVLLLTCLFI